MKRVQIQYFAIFRDMAQTESETVETNATTLGELYRELAAKYNFTLPEGLVRPAVGCSLESMEAPVTDGAQVAFLPPAAGG